MTRALQMIVFALLLTCPAAAKEPELLHTLTGHSKCIEAVVFAPDGKTLASGGYDDTIRLWDAADGGLLATWKTWHVVSSLAFCPPNGHVLAFGTHSGIGLRDVVTGDNISGFGEYHKDRFAGDFGIPDAQFTYVESIAVSPDGKTIAVGSDTVTFRNINSGELTSPLANAGPTHSLAFSPDGKKLAADVGSDPGKIAIWDVAKGKCLVTLCGHADTVESVAFSPDGKTLASGSLDCTVKLWDIASGRNTFTCEGHEGWVVSVMFSPDGTTLASGSLDETIKLWNVATGQNTTTIKGHTDGVLSVAFSPDGRTLASGGNDGTIKLWSIDGDD